MINCLAAAFVVASSKNLVTVVTVENQHVKHPLSIESRAVSMDWLPQNRHYCAIGSMVFSRGPEICQRPGFTRGSGSSGYSSLARWSDLLVPLLFNQVTSFVNGELRSFFSLVTRQKPMKTAFLVWKESEKTSFSTTGE